MKVCWDSPFIIIIGDKISVPLYSKEDISQNYKKLLCITKGRSLNDGVKKWVNKREV